jgi:hypothetical protein
MLESPILNQDAIDFVYSAFENPSTKFKITILEHDEGVSSVSGKNEFEFTGWEALEAIEKAFFDEDIDHLKQSPAVDRREESKLITDVDYILLKHAPQYSDSTYLESPLEISNIANTLRNVLHHLLETQPKGSLKAIDILSSIMATAPLRLYSSISYLPNIKSTDKKPDLLVFCMLDDDLADCFQKMVDHIEKSDGKTKTVILLTTKWQPEAFSPYINDIQRFTKSGLLLIFIFYSLLGATEVHLPES